MKFGGRLWLIGKDGQPAMIKACDRGDVTTSRCVEAGSQQWWRAVTVDRGVNPTALMDGHLGIRSIRLGAEIQGPRRARHTSNDSDESTAIRSRAIREDVEAGVLWYQAILARR